MGTGLLGRVRPNSRLHWTLLVVSLFAALLFTTVYVVDGLLRSGYDPVRQPMSALSLGGAGWIQIANFIVFGSLSCLAAFAWRSTLAPGFGAVWYPRLRVLHGLALICAGVFSQDPALGFPAGVPEPAHPSAHAVLHNLASYLTMVTILVELVILARRFRREPDWRGWGVAAIVTAVAMMSCLAAFGTLMSQGGRGGIFEKLAVFWPTLFGFAIVIRLVRQRDARIGATGLVVPPVGQAPETPGTLLREAQK